MYVPMFVENLQDASPGSKRAAVSSDTAVASLCTAGVQMLRSQLQEPASIA